MLRDGGFTIDLDRLQSWDALNNVGVDRRGAVGFEIGEAAVEELIVGGEMALQISEATLPANLLIIEALGNEVVELVKDELQVGVHDATRTLSAGEVGMIGDSYPRQAEGGKGVDGSVKSDTILLAHT